MIARPSGVIASAAVAAGAIGCTPLLMPPPVHLGETARVLQGGDVSLTAAGGYAGGAFGNGGGASARVRAGIGYGQEVGGEVTLASASANSGGVDIGGMVGGAKASWKGAPASWLAFIIGAGFGSSKTGNTIGVDAAAVVSPNWDTWQPYIGLRGSLVHRVSGRYPLLNQQVLTVPIGLALSPSPRWRLFLEAGLVWCWSRDLPQDHNPEGIGYVGLGGAVIFGR